jgi:hypothetical protein
MAKETHWEDVRLLSFDLQTVEFAYALVSAIDPFDRMLRSVLSSGMRRIIPYLFRAKINSPPLGATLTSVSPAAGLRLGRTSAKNAILTIMQNRSYGIFYDTDMVVLLHLYTD